MSELSIYMIERFEQVIIFVESFLTPILAYDFKLKMQMDHWLDKKIIGFVLKHQDFL